MAEEYRLHTDKKLIGNKIYQYWESIANRDGWRKLIKAVDEERGYIPVIGAFMFSGWFTICYLFETYNKNPNEVGSSFESFSVLIYPMSIMIFLLIIFFILIYKIMNKQRA